MKKYFLTALFMLSAAGVVFAAGEFRGTPRGDPQALATADYGGVYASVSSFPVSGTGVNFSSIVIPTSNDVSGYTQGVFYGVMFSSGALGALDFVDVFDSTSSDRAQKEGAIMRVYNVGLSTGGSFQPSFNGWNGPAKPVRFFKGLILRANVATYNSITTLYYREP